MFVVTRSTSPDPKKVGWTVGRMEELVVFE